MKYLFLISITFLLTNCGSKTVVVNKPVNTNISHPYLSPKISEEEKNKFLFLVNKMRSSAHICGGKRYEATHSLNWNDKLYSSAYEHTKDMILAHNFSHVGSGTNSDWTANTQNLGHSSTFMDRIKNSGYISNGASENIAYGPYTDEEVINKFMNSAGHCRNIMNPIFTDFGMAKIKSPDGYYYWTQNFGAKRTF